MCLCILAFVRMYVLSCAYVYICEHSCTCIDACLSVCMALCVGACVRNGMTVDYMIMMCNNRLLCQTRSQLAIRLAGASGTVSDVDR